MPVETKKEMIARLSAGRAAEEPARLAAMPLTLLSLMARSTACGLDTKVSRNLTGDIIVSFNDRYGDFRVLSLSSSGQAVYNVECGIEMKEAADADARDLEARRRAARAKLTAKDLEVLGLR